MPKRLSRFENDQNLLQTSENCKFCNRSRKLNILMSLGLCDVSQVIGKEEAYVMKRAVPRAGALASLLPSGPSTPVRRVRNPVTRRPVAGWPGPRGIALCHVLQCRLDGACGHHGSGAVPSIAAVTVIAGARACQFLVTGPICGGWQIKTG